MSTREQILEKIIGYENKGRELKLDNDEISQLIHALTLADEKSARLRSITESSEDAIITKNLDGIITSWNSAAERIFGYSADEIIGNSILKLIPTHLHEEEQTFLSELRRGNRIDHFETQRLRSDGSFVEVSLTISPIFDASGQIIGISKIARDMTLYRKAEINAHRLMAIVESSDDAIISKDFNSIITSWNASATRIFGYSSQEMIGQSILKLIPLERHDEEPKILAQLRKGIRVEHFETQRLRKDGSLIHVSLTISPIKDTRGNVVGLSKIARDITDKKLMEQKKDEFLSFVSHELKTPLTSLKSYIDVATRKPADQAFLLKALDRAKGQAKKMESMIRDFLNISRIEDGHIRIEKSAVNLAGLLDECITDARVISQRHKIIYKGLSRCMVYADREKIAMVMTNLISNAQKYSPAGGDITVSCEKYDQNVMIKVSDHGIGISSEDQKSMFQKFYRVETEQTRFIKGFGIGLYLVSTILSLHGSAIKLDSAPGEGSTFFFTLPFKQDPQQ